MLASIRSFTRRGVDGFARRPGESEEEYLPGFLDRFQAQLARMAATPSTVERLVVRYEDLVADPFGTADLIGTWLGTELDADAVIRDRPRHDHHVTSGSVERSVGRWARDLRPDESDLVARRLGPAMEPFGYRL